MNNDLIRQFMDQPGYGPAPESAAKVQAWLDSYKRQFGHFINNMNVLNSGATLRKIICPATKETLAEVADGTEHDVAAALDAAHSAFYRWSCLDPYEISKILYAIGRCFQKNARLFAVLGSLENGSPIREMRDLDGRLVEEDFFYHAAWAMRYKKEFSAFESAGVITQIVPWNFPLLMLAWKVARAIAMGNTVVLKPAQTTPLTALMFAEMIKEETDIPPGVINIVCGGVETGQALVRETARRANKDPVYAGLKFTGSTDVGRWIRKETAGSGLHLTMELGGKGAFIVCADADLHSAARSAIDAGLGFRQGQVCSAGSRIFVEESARESFVMILQEELKKLVAGHPLDKSIDIGAVNSEAQYERIKHYLKIAEDEGATLWSPPGFVCKESGYYIPPTLVTGVSQSSRIAQEEIFGPVFTVMTFRTPEQAIDLGNNTRYGLAASVLSESVGKIGQIARGLEVGVVWTNSANRFDPSSEFGGRKESGYGREGGRGGVLEVLKPSRLFAQSSFPAVRRKKTDEDYQLAQRRIGIDRTYRFLVNGAPKRPDGESCFRKYAPDGTFLANLPEANRKDVRDAVDASRKALAGWKTKTASDRAKIIRYISEKMEEQQARLEDAVARETGWPLAAARLEVEAARKRFFDFAALAQTYDGTIPPAAANTLTLSLKEPMGVMGVRAPDEFPLLGLATVIGAALAMGNTITVLAGRYSYAAMELVDALLLSTLPPGVLNLLCCEHPDSTAKDSPLYTLAAHEEVKSMWHFGSAEAATMVEEVSVFNMKRTFVSYGRPVDWQSDDYLDYFCHGATAIKSLWIPYGV